MIDNFMNNSRLPEYYSFTPAVTGPPTQSRHVEVDVSSLDDVETLPDCGNGSSLNELIINANIIRETLRGLGFPEETEYETVNRLRVEQDLKSVYLHEATGFSLKLKGYPCCPKLTLTPKNPLDAELPSRNSLALKFKGTSECGCFCCCMPISLSWQKMTWRLNEQEILSFTYRPQLWTFWRQKPRKVDIFVPQRSETIGSIMYGKSFAEKTIMIDRISRSVFLTAKMESSYENVLEFPRIMIRDNLGMPMAVAQATAGISTNGVTRWTEFELSFSPLAINESASAKTIMAVAFAMWVITRREESSREAWAIILIAILANIVIFTYLKLA